MSCHTSCNPPSPALKTVTLSLNPRSLLPEQPHRRTSKSDTPPISPYPPSPQLFVMAWQGLFRGKLTMSGISGVTGKMKPEVSAQRKVWKDGEEYSHRGFFTSMLSDTPTLLNLINGCISYRFPTTVHSSPQFLWGGSNWYACKILGMWCNPIFLIVSAGKCSHAELKLFCSKIVKYCET